MSFRLRQLALLFGFVVAFTSRLAAQQPEEDGSGKLNVIRAFADGESGAVFVAGTGDGANLPLAISSLGGADFQIGMGGIGVGGMSIPADDLGMLGMDQIQSELDLVDRQKEQLSALRKDINERRRTVMGDLRSIEPAKIRTQFRELETKIQEETRTKLAEILLPHQLDRLKQLKVQMQVRNRGLNALAGADLADALNLTDEQKAKLAEKQAETVKQLREKMEELRQKLQQDVLNDVLTPEQRSKLTKLTGNEFKVKPVDPPAIRTGGERRVIRATP